MTTPESLPTSPVSRSDSSPPAWPLFAWIGLLVLAHRAALGLHGVRTTSDPIESFFFEAGATVPILHYLVFAFVVWSRRHALACTSARNTAPVAAALCAVLGTGVFIWAQLSGQLDLLIDSITLLLAAGGLWRGGWRQLGQLALPLFVLWLARPWPPMLIHQIHEWLQSLTSDIAVLLLSPFGDVGRSGHLLSFRGQLFQVIEGCSGLRSTWTLVFGTLFYAELFSRSRRQTLGLIVLAVLLGIAVNGLRVISIMVFPGNDVSADHSIQGLIMISLGIVLVATLDSLGDRWLWPRGDRSWRQPDPDSSTSKGASLEEGRWRVPATLAGGLLLISFVPFDLPRPEPVAWQLHEIPRELDGWVQRRTHDLDFQHLGSVDFRDKLYREYGRGDDRVLLFVAADDRTRRDQSVLSPKTRSEGSGWQIEDVASIRLPNMDRRVERIMQRRGSERALSIHFRQGELDLARESLRWLLAYDLLPGRRPVEIGVVRITTPILDGDIVRAQAILLDFLDALRIDLARAAPSATNAEDAL